MKIRIKYLADIPKIEKIETGDWIDLRASKDIDIHYGEYVEIPLGIAMELPEDYEAHVVPRSSMFRKYGLLQVNSVGIIDNSYCGDNDEWHLPVFCLRSHSKIHKGDRLCQFRITRRMPQVEMIEVETLNNVDRGGLGSTGVN